MFPFAQLFKKFHVFTYLWLHWVFIVMQRLSLVAVRRLLLLRSTGCRHTGFSSCRWWALEFGISSRTAWTELPYSLWDLWTRDQTSVPCIGRQILNQWVSVGSDSKESACNAGDQGSIPGSGRPPGEGNGSPLQCSCLENPMNRGAWRATQSMGSQRATERLTLSLFLNQWTTRKVPIMHLKPCKFKLD